MDEIARVQIQPLPLEQCVEGPARIPLGPKRAEPLRTERAAASGKVTRNQDTGFFEQFAQSRNGEFGPWRSLAVQAREQSRGSIRRVDPASGKDVGVGHEAAAAAAARHEDGESAFLFAHEHDGSGWAWHAGAIVFHPLCATMKSNGRSQLMKWLVQQYMQGMRVTATRL